MSLSDKKDVGRELAGFKRAGGRHGTGGTRLLEHHSQGDRYPQGLCWPGRDAEPHMGTSVPGCHLANGN